MCIINDSHLKQITTADQHSCSVFTRQFISNSSHQQNEAHFLHTKCHCTLTDTINKKTTKGKKPRGTFADK